MSPSAFGARGTLFSMKDPPAPAGHTRIPSLTPVHPWSVLLNTHSFWLVKQRSGPTAGTWSCRRTSHRRPGIEGSLCLRVAGQKNRQCTLSCSATESSSSELGVADTLAVGQERPRRDVTGEGENAAVIEHAFEAGGGTIPAHALFSVEPVSAASALGIAMGDAFSELGAVILSRCSGQTLDASPSM